MEKAVYIRLRHRIQVNPHEIVYLKDIAQIIADEQTLPLINKMPICKVRKEDRNIIILDVMKVIKLLRNHFIDLDIQTIGPPQTIVEVVLKRKKVSIVNFILIWLLLFTGASLAIMNFHEDVAMREVHQRLYLIFTGKESLQPLVFQIPYSIGLGLGMILFFNHFFRKRINEEPSPLEVEMFNYQQNLDQYVVMHENKESMKHIDDD